MFAHMIVGNTNSYTVADWESNIRLAASKGIDAFVLNIAPPLDGTTGTQTANDFGAAANVASNFKLFFSFDYEGSGQPWSTEDVLSLLEQYGRDEYHYKVHITMSSFILIVPLTYFRSTTNLSSPPSKVPATPTLPNGPPSGPPSPPTSTSSPTGPRSHQTGTPISSTVSSAGTCGPSAPAT